MLHQGGISYKDIGCFKDNGQIPRPLPELLFTDRDPKDVVYSGIPVHGQDFDAYVTDLVCRYVLEGLLLIGYVITFDRYRSGSKSIEVEKIFISLKNMQKDFIVPQ